MVTLAFSLLVACKKRVESSEQAKSDVITEKLATGQQLTEEETKKYSKNKKSIKWYNAAVEELKRKAIEKKAAAVHEAVNAKQAPQKVESGAAASGKVEAKVDTMSHVKEEEEFIKLKKLPPIPPIPTLVEE